MSKVGGGKRGEVGVEGLFRAKHQFVLTLSSMLLLCASLLINL